MRIPTPKMLDHADGIEVNHVSKMSLQYRPSDDRERGGRGNRGRPPLEPNPLI